MKMVKHENVVKLYEVLASRTKVRARIAAAKQAPGSQCVVVVAEFCRTDLSTPSPPSPRGQIFIVLELITGGELFDKIVAEGR
jgi:serine/threonine protein kinase